MAEIGKHVKPIDRAQDETYVASARTVAACLAVSVAIVALICLVQVPKYAMPDDFMQDLYARGAYLDTPGFLMLYSLVGFSAPISWLYALLPAVPWYPVALLSLIAISFAAVGVTVVSARVPAPLKVFLAGALALCEVMATVYLTYTIVAFIACAAGVVLVLRRAAFCRPQGFRASDVLAFALIVEGFSLRPESGAAALVLFVPFLVWALACNRNARTMAFAVGVVAAMGLSYAAGMIAWRITPGWEEFQQTFKAAQAVADYPVVDYEDVQQVAPELSQTDVDMIYEFIFVDADTYSLETFQALDGVVEGYGFATMLAGMVARVSFTAFAFGLLVVLAATAASSAPRGASPRGRARSRGPSPRSRSPSSCSSFSGHASRSTCSCPSSSWRSSPSWCAASSRGGGTATRARSVRSASSWGAWCPWPACSPTPPSSACCGSPTSGRCRRRSATSSPRTPRRTSHPMRISSCSSPTRRVSS